MKTMRLMLIGSLLSISGAASAQIMAPNPLVGAWHLAAIDEPEPDGKVVSHTDRKGSLIYTADGRMAVQVMYPLSAATANHGPVQYALGGYEASFGSFTVDTKAHTVTHHVEGAIVRSLVGADLPRTYTVTGHRMVIRSSRPDERWAVTWERF